tara:strand:+ start:269 stop:490 length:222 start_codon:yes stop_codon:yes gene_type:complete
MFQNQYYHIFSGSSIEVLALKDSLDQINIKPIIKDQGESARLAGFGVITPLLQEVYVHKDEFEKAKILMNQLF